MAEAKVYIVGAGPGDPDLLTLRGQRIIAEADLVIYADSLVTQAVAQLAKPQAEVIASSGLTLEQIVEKMRDAIHAGQTVARVHSGDPALYGALYEQLAYLQAQGIEYEIVPGVSAVFAAAARLGVELTVPEVAQSLILTRMSGRASPVPALENLTAMAQHRTSLAIYLSITRCREMVGELLAGGYPPSTPVAALYQVSWPDEQIIVCELHELADQVARAGFSRQTLVLVGEALAPALQRERRSLRSQLYHPAHSHVFRKGTSGAVSPSEKTEAALVTTPPAPTEKVEKKPEKTVGIAILSLTKNGTLLAEKLQAGLSQNLPAQVFAPARFAGSNSTAYRGKPLELVKELFSEFSQLVLVMPVAVAVRAVGKLAEDKRRDPGVVVLDEAGKFAISLLSGHLGGANRLAEQVAQLSGGQAVITTASDGQGFPALDLLGQEQGWQIANPEKLTQVSAALINGDTVGLWQESGTNLLGDYTALNLKSVSAPEELVAEEIAAGVVITHHRPEIFQAALREKALFYHPPVLWVGIGCRRGVSRQKIEQTVRTVLQERGLAFAAVAGLASADIKQNEAGLLEFAQAFSLPLNFYSAAELNAVDPAHLASSSAAQELLGVQGVAEPAALLAAGAKNLMLAKVRNQDVTVAVALREISSLPTDNQILESSKGKEA